MFRRPVKWIWQRTGKELKYTDWATWAKWTVGTGLGGDCLFMWQTPNLKWDDADCNKGSSEIKPICQKFA